jgi:MFS family permease
MSTAPGRGAVIFLAFAFTYFLSALLRAVTATLAPVFSAELGLQAANLGLLAGAFFLGFASMQLPLGQALDRWGPRRTLVALLTLAIIGCMAFALAPGLPGLIAARLLTGAGLAACLMAPLTLYRQIFTPAAQLRCNSWMLMTGSLGMLSSTLPVQWLLPHIGWRGLFWAIAGLLTVGLLLICGLVPRDHPAPASAQLSTASYLEITSQDIFIRMAPLGFFLYGGMIAVQSLWAGPWLTQVVGQTSAQAAQGLFVINLCMLFAFLSWGAWMPRMARLGLDAARLMTWGVPVALGLLGLNVYLGSAAEAGHWALWCVASTFVSVSQPAVGAAFPAHQAGRALSAFNLVIFSGVFCVQWGIGLLVDGFKAGGLAEPAAFRGALSVLGICCVGAYVWFVHRRPRRYP